MILIDFIPGSHGHYLTVSLNSILAGNCIDTFNELGASYTKYARRPTDRFFPAHIAFPAKNHEFRYDEFESIVSISPTDYDLPLLQSLVFYRAGDASINLNDEECVAKIISDGRTGNLQHPVLIDFYRLISNWTEINRNSIREMLKMSFDPMRNGIMKKYRSINYPRHLKVVDFPFRSFYSKNSFIESIARVFQEFNMDVSIPDCIIDMHHKFLSLNPFKDMYELPEHYLSKIEDGADEVIKPLTIYQEAYLDYLYEKQYDIEAFFNHPDSVYFKRTGEILNYIKSDSRQQK